MGQTGKKFPKVISHSKKALQLRDTSGSFHLHDGFYLLLIWTNSFLVDDMPKKLYLSFCEPTFSFVQGNSCLPESREDVSQVSVVFCSCGSVHKDVVHVANLSFDSAQKLAHLLLEELWSRCNTERKSLKLKASKWCDEGGQNLGLLSKLKLPESRICINF